MKMLVDSNTTIVSINLKLMADNIIMLLYSNTTIVSINRPVLVYYLQWQC